SILRATTGNLKLALRPCCFVLFRQFAPKVNLLLLFICVRHWRHVQSQCRRFLMHHSISLPSVVVLVGVVSTKSVNVKPKKRRPNSTQKPNRFKPVRISATT